MSFATPSRPGAVPTPHGATSPSAGRPEPARRPSVSRSCCPLLSPLGEAEGSRGMHSPRWGYQRPRARDDVVRACAGRAEPGRLSARPGVYLMTSHVPTSDWHCGQTANCCHRQLRAADACLTAQVARHPRSRISDGVELVGPLRPQALRVRHGYWLAASWRLETAQVGAKARRLTWMGGGGIDGGRAAAPAAMSWLANSRLPVAEAGQATPRAGELHDLRGHERDTADAHRADGHRAGRPVV